MTHPADRTALSLFVPENFPSDEEVIEGIDYFCQHPDSVRMPEPLRTANALCSFAVTLTPMYDQDFEPLEVALNTNSSNCLTETAIVALAGRLLLESSCIPTIEVSWSKDDKNKTLHGFTTMATSSGQIVRCDRGFTGIDIYPNQMPSNRRRFEHLVCKNPELLENDGIVQLRLSRDGEFAVHTDVSARTPYDESIEEAWTFFPGEEGLKSYLNTIELMSARKQLRTPETYPAQLIPRL